MLLKENKFDLAVKSYTIISNNYLVEFKEFISNTLVDSSGLIWNGTIHWDCAINCVNRNNKK